MLLDLDRFHVKTRLITPHRGQDLDLLAQNAMDCVGKSVLGDCGLLRLVKTAATTVFTDAGANATLYGANVYLATRARHTIHPAERQRIPGVPHRSHELLDLPW